jgi:hypothetical protein
MHLKKAEQIYFQARLLNCWLRIQAFIRNKHLKVKNGNIAVLNG